MFCIFSPQWKVKMLKAAVLLEVIHITLFYVFFLKASVFAQHIRHISLVFPYTLNIRLRFKVSVSHVAIYLFVMHIKLSLHTLAAIILCGLMSDLLPYFKVLCGLTYPQL